MVNFELRCKKCNSYTRVKILDSDYFKWLVSNDVEDLKLSYDDKITYYSMKCKKCRDEERSKLLEEKRKLEEAQEKLISSELDEETKRLMDDPFYLDEIAKWDSIDESE